LTTGPRGGRSSAANTRAKPVDRNGITTYERIYAVIRRVPRGNVVTYGRVAEAAGCSGPRQVGYALHALGERTAVPWHRVINAQGAISLAGASAITQRLRLETEGVRFNARGRVDLELFGWVSRRRRQ
jgi:methylated-DNA-protein-cysteine methyltransferase related protein